MEKVIQRFPSMGKSIFRQMDDKSLANSKEVSRIWKNFIDHEKTIWIRMIQKHVPNFQNPDWQKSVSKIPTDIVRALTATVLKFYKSDPTRYDETWSPLHITVEQGIVDLSRLVIDRIHDKNHHKQSPGVAPGTS